MVEITLPIVLQFLQTAGLLVGIIYYITIMRSQQRNQQLTLDTRRSQHYMQLLQTVSTEEFMKRTRVVLEIEIKDFDDYVRLSRDHESDIGLKFIAYTGWINGVGHMLKEGLIDERMIEHFGVGIQYGRAWDKWRPFIMEYRERLHIPWYMNGLEYLSEEMRKSRMKRGLPHRYSETLRQFVEDTE
jgi:hypothetical protein